MTPFKLTALCATILTMAAPAAMAGEVCEGKFGDTPTTVELRADGTSVYTFGEDSWTQPVHKTATGTKFFHVGNGAPVVIIEPGENSNKMYLTWSRGGSGVYPAVVTCPTKAPIDMLAGF